MLPKIPNEVFDCAESGRSSELGSFELCQDQQFGFYFNSEYQSVDYDSDRYQNEQAHSSIFVRHLQVVAQEICSRFGKNSSVVEVGCGKGYFWNTLGPKLH
jgi:tRNA G46 methylase TrmB